VGATLTIDGAGFDVLKASRPGENEMSRQVSIEELNRILPYSDVYVDFLLPTGFKSGNRQITFPKPEIFFGSLSIRLQKSMAMENFFDNAIFSRVSIGDYSLSSTAVRLKNNQVFRGCTGKVRYSFETLAEAERVFLSRLAALAPFCGVGYKVTQGMGLVKIQFSAE
jgi:CRISPR-associated endoribonuclease Cas6